jgi:hypothetical protein
MTKPADNSVSFPIPDRFKYLINDPEARYDIRKAFYEKYGENLNIWRRIWAFFIKLLTGGAGLGRSELDFLRWEIKRGVLNSLDDPRQPGSKWWRDVNLQFIIISETAAEIYEGKNATEPVTHEIQLWLDYIQNRTGISWYRAHNGTILKGYLNCIAQANEESVYERIFMNEVLYRVLFAQAMEEDDSFIKGLGKIVANPMFQAVDIITNIPAFYPDDYPLSERDIKFVMHEGRSLDADLEYIFDRVLILPNLKKLYEQAAKWLGNPELLSLISIAGKPIYPDLSKQLKKH